MRSFLTLVFLLVSSFAYALEIEDYKVEKLAKLEEEKADYIVHYYAHWYPICVDQVRAFNSFKESKLFPEVVLLRANFEKETELREKFKVNRQSNIIVFKAGKEVARFAEIGNSDRIKSLLEANLK